jgi:uncharacterized protein (TIGR02246 family)
MACLARSPLRGCGALEREPDEMDEHIAWRPKIMKRRVLVAAVMCAATSFAAGAPSRDEEGLRALVQTIVEGWNNANGSMIASVYAADGTLVAGDGTVTRGPGEIARYHDRQFQDFLKGTRLSVDVRSVHFLSENVALMQTEGGILWPGQQQFAPGNRGIQSFIAVREGQTWRVRLFQNTRVRHAEN